MSAHAIGIMLKSILGSRVDPIISKVDELTADGTIDRAVALLRLLAQEGAFEKAVSLLRELERHNELLARIETLFTEYVGHDDDGNLFARTDDAIRAGQALITHSGAGRSSADGSAADHGPGGAGEPGAN